VNAVSWQNFIPRAGVRYGDDSGVDEDDVIHIGRIDFRNDKRVFGIKGEDRFLHVYVIGKTGTGKSTLIETMALQDLERGNGFALIDPHGDLVARVAARVPALHRERVIYLNATDPTQPTATIPFVTSAKIASLWPLPA
jgi:DNA helicase HerA-like ATPase